jgi:hypothetical protein
MMKKKLPGNKRTFFVDVITILLFVVIVFVMFSAKPPVKISSTSFTRSSLLFNINVTTNVNCFTCDYQSDILDTVSAVGFNIGNSFIRSGAQLAIPINFIDCHNDVMNSDMKELLRVENHPHILVKIENYKINDNDPKLLTVDIDLNINGTEKEYSIGVMNYQENAKMYVHGSFPVDLKDFCITPPSKFLGLVKVDKIINISFTLVMNQG